MQMDQPIHPRRDDGPDAARRDFLDILTECGWIPTRGVDALIDGLVRSGDDR